MAERKEVQVTSAPWIGNFGDYCGVMAELNKSGPPVGGEIYAVSHRLPISEQTASKVPIKSIQENLYAFRDGRVSVDRIRAWQEKYGKFPIERIHMPFHWSIPSGLYNFFVHSLIKEPGDAGDRWKIALPITYMTMTAMNGFATKLAGEIACELDVPAPGLNAHVNIIEEAEKRNKILFIRGDAGYIFVENDLDYPRSRFDQFEKERDPQRAIDAVKRNDLEGVIYGLDHAYRAMRNPENKKRFDPREDFEKFESQFREHLRVIHMAGSLGDHGLILPNDTEFWDFVDFVKGRIEDDVVFCVDLSPVEMGKKSPGQQVEYTRDLVEKLQAA